MERAPIEVRAEGLRHSVRIGDAADFEIEDVVPFGVESGQPARLTGIFHPAASELTIGHATRSKIDAFAIRYDGNSGFSTPQVSWAADRRCGQPPRRRTARVRHALAAARARLGRVLLLLAFAGAAWWSTVDRMAGMDGGPGTGLGTLGWFLGVWVVMMAAMMFPSLAPTTAVLHARMTRRRGWSRPLLFTAAYLLVWGAAGLVAYGLFRLGRNALGSELT
ncbi:MAG: DUF2182 domain-containing protein [Solirubrobacterales bacterium]|nr:DUF2182 domain-containing protein [Solirubrobacterales bacterium]